MEIKIDFWACARSLLGLIIWWLLCKFLLWGPISRMFGRETEMGWDTTIGLTVGWVVGELSFILFNLIG